MFSHRGGKTGYLFTPSVRFLYNKTFFLILQMHNHSPENSVETCNCKFCIEASFLLHPPQGAGWRDGVLVGGAPDQDGG